MATSVQLQQRKAWPTAPPSAQGARCTDRVDARAARVPANYRPRRSRVARGGVKRIRREPPRRVLPYQNPTGIRVPNNRPAPAVAVVPPLVLAPMCRVPTHAHADRDVVERDEHDQRRHRRCHWRPPQLPCSYRRELAPLATSASVGTRARLSWRTAGPSTACRRRLRRTRPWTRRTCPQR